MSSSYTYRKIWIENYGKIPIDERGRTYEIHHIDGDRNNNDIKNLICVPIEEHYKIHYEQGDYGACVMIAKRMELPPDFISNIQKGKKRPGIGGVKKGTIPWNKGKKGIINNISEKGKILKYEALKRRSKIKDHDAENIRKDYHNRVIIDNDKIGKVQRNGKIYSYEQAFCLYYSLKYDVSLNYIRRIINGKSKIS